MSDTPPAEAWIELSVDLPVDDGLQDIVCTVLYGAGADSLVEHDETTMGGAEVPRGRRRLVTYFPAIHAAMISDLRGTLRTLGLTHGAEVSVEIRDFTDTNWREGWKSWFRPALVSPRLGVRAPWAELDAPPGAQVLVIEPGLAFGTGLHETTRLCMRAIDRLVGVTPPAALLDVGCGSGVLAIAASRLGVPRVLGIDIDPIAVEVATVNADLNIARCEFSTTPVDRVAGQFPIVVANILSGVLIDLAPALIDRTEPGGFLLLSGLLSDEADRVEQAFVARGIEPVRRDALGEWSSLELRRRPGS